MKNLAQILIIIATLVITSLLSAQQVPIRLSGPALQIPESWEYSYDPPEVLLNLTVQPDSSLALDRILDEKQELLYLVVEHLQKFNFVLPPDSLVACNQLAAVLTLSQTATSVAVKKSGPNQTEIDAWIMERSRLASRSEASTLDFAQPGNTQFPAYLAGLFSYALSSDFTQNSVNGFPLDSSFLASSFYSEMMGKLYDRQFSLPGPGFRTPDLPEGITLSTLQAGLGDYEHRYARGFVGKNGLFGRPGLRLSLDFLLQNGYWLDRNSSGSSLKGALSVPLGPTTLDLEVADFRGPVSMLQMRPEYWQIFDYTAEERYRLYYLSWRNPLVDLSLLGTYESIRSDAFASALQNDALRLRAGRTFKISSLRMKAEYEHNFLAASELLPDVGYTDRLGVNLDYDGRLLQAETGLRLMDKDRWEFWGTGVISVRQLQFKPYGKLYINDVYTEYSVPNIFDGVSPMLGYRIVPKSDWGLQASFTGLPAFEVNVSAGQKHVLASYILVSPTANMPVDLDIPYLAASLAFEPQWRKWTIKWLSSATHHFKAPSYPVEPDYAYQSSFRLSRDLGYGNALSAGLDLLGHSSFITDNGVGVVSNIDSSIIGDLWLAVQISPKFEFKVAWKNVADSSIYGVYPLPSSLHASLRWFFVN